MSDFYITDVSTIIFNCKKPEHILHTTFLNRPNETGSLFKGSKSLETTAFNCNYMSCYCVSVWCSGLQWSVKSSSVMWVLWAIKGNHFNPH